MKAQDKLRIAELLKQASDLLNAYPDREDPAPQEPIVKVANDSPQFALNFAELRSYLDAR